MPHAGESTAQQTAQPPALASDVAAGTARTAGGRFPPPQPVPTGGEALLASLEARVDESVAALMRRPSWAALVEGDDAALSRGVMREVYREVVWFFSPVVESGLAMAGRLAWVDTSLMRELAEHMYEETLHRKTALDGYLALGGALDAVERAPMSPTAFAVASVWRGLERMASPLSYLGAMLLFEASTPRLCEPLSARLAALGVSAAGAHHINLHKTADVEHSALFRRWIVRLVDRDPAAAAPIAYGMDCFRVVYPGPVFDAAHARAAAESAGR
jgi:hypothetical protein